jgi:endo-1,4-beta-xylanase
VTSQWNAGFTGQVTIACSGASLSSWRASWTYGAGQQLTQAWNATCTQSGAAVTCANATYNGTVPDGGSVTFGFNASWSGGNPVPVVTLG